MARVKAVYRPGDYPGIPDEATRKDLADLFDHLFPGVENPEIDQSHAGVAIAAQSPRLALGMARLSAVIAGELPWSQRRDLRELAMQTVNVHFKSHYSFRARAAPAEAAGIGPDLQAAIGTWRTSALFNDEQRLIIEYGEAVMSGDVPSELFARVVGQYGEKGTIELTSLVAFWSCWAMFLNATRPDED